MSCYFIYFVNWLQACVRGNCSETYETAHSVYHPQLKWVGLSLYSFSLSQ